MTENVFTTIKNLKTELSQKGMTIYDFSIGSPGTKPAGKWLEVLSKEVLDQDAYRYPVKENPELMEALCRWYKRCHGVELDNEREVMALLGSHDALVHFCLAFTEPGDTVILPDPCYPAITAGVDVSRTAPYYIPIYERDRMDAKEYFESIPEAVAKRAKIIYINYPQNPTTLLADDDFYNELIAFAGKYDIIVFSDSAYLDLVFDGERAKSFLSYSGAKEVGVELTSLSKSHGIAGIRVGFAAGNAQIIERFRDFKSNMDYNIFLPIQKMAEYALDNGDDTVEANRVIYQKKRDLLIKGMEEAGWKGAVSYGTVFLWAPIPDIYGSDDVGFCDRLARETGVLVVPGSAFGDAGKGHVRFALVMGDEDIQRAVDSLKRSDVF